MPKTVILDAETTNPGDLSWDWLKEYGELEIYPRTPKELILKRCKNADTVITNKTPLEKDDLEKMPNLKFVAVLATGYNVVDTVYLMQHLSESHAGKTDVIAPFSCVFSMYPVARKKSS